MQSRTGSMTPACMKNEKPLLITTQVKLVDPADKYVACNQMLFVFVPCILLVKILLWF